MPTREHVVLLINGQRREVRGDDCFLNLAEYLRSRRGLVGTKLVCSEGDCGSCTVLVGRPCNSTVHYLPVNSCIRLMFQMDGTHVVTVEGLAQAGQLTRVQQALVDCHGSQCGFCTPGFVMAMTGICESHSEAQPTDSDWRHGLAGNLCRCTGYSPILAAGRSAAAQAVPRLDQHYRSAELMAQLTPLATDALDIQGRRWDTSLRAHCPTTLEEAVAVRAAFPAAKVVAGATDVGVQWNKRSIEPAHFLDLNRIDALSGVRLEPRAGGSQLVAGARATWSEVYEVCQSAVPEFARIVAVFGSPQIRHVGTLGGNIMNASPVADALPFLFVMDAELELLSSVDRRYVNINDFYRGYKQLDLRSNELLAQVRIPLPAKNEMLRLYKVSRRRDLDIATFTAAIRMQLDEDRIAQAALAYGAVAPTVVRLRNTEQFLLGRTFDAATMRAAGDVAVTEIAPLSDVRGSAAYRRQLARNVLLKFYYECEVGTMTSTASSHPYSQ